jgi:phenylacetate-coenzyme A ligase PaaK-like adenylate-forming protein
METPPGMPSYAGLSAATLDSALRDLPAYREWRECDPGPHHPVGSRYAALPHTTKERIREFFPSGFLLPGRDLQSGLAQGEISLAQTSGTTSEQVTTLWCQPWWDASERASWTLNAHAAAAGLGAHREALLASPRSVGIARPDGSRLPMDARRQGRFLFLNEEPDPTRWTDDDIRRIADELDLFEPVALEANPSFLARFCLRALRLGLKVREPRLIVLTFELPSRAHRRLIRRLFPETPQMGSHGSTETGYVFAECEHGRYHQNVRSCRVDVEPFNARRGDPGVGRFLVTPFHHPWYSLLRFHIGDLGHVSQDSCPCGRSDGLVLDRLEGRLSDLTLRADGTAVTVEALDAAVGDVPGLAAYEVSQPALGQIHLRLVADGDSSPLDPARRAAERLYGPGTRVDASIEEDFGPEPSGKYRLARTGFDSDISSLFA